MRQIKIIFTAGNPGIVDVNGLYFLMFETVLKTNNDRVSVPVLGGTIAFSFYDPYDWNLKKKVPVPVYGEIRLCARNARGRRRRRGIRIAEQGVVR